MLKSEKQTFEKGSKDYDDSPGTGHTVKLRKYPAARPLSIIGGAVQ